MRRSISPRRGCFHAKAPECPPPAGAPGPREGAALRVVLVAAVRRGSGLAPRRLAVLQFPAIVRVIEHLVEYFLLEPPLSPDLDAGDAALLGEPVQRPLLDVEVFGSVPDIKDAIHSSRPPLTVLDGRLTPETK